MQNAKSEDDKNKILSEFTKSMLIRYIISGVFMLALSVSFFYYCIVFCGIYIKTQYGWFYSGIWALFLNWVVYAPLYILIVSLVEFHSKKEVTFYLKRFFPF